MTDKPRSHKVVQIQLTRIEKAGEVVGKKVTRVDGYSHAANLLHWAYQQGLIKASESDYRPGPEPFVDTDKPVSLTPRGEEWLDHFGRADA